MKSLKIYEMKISIIMYPLILPHYLNIFMQVFTHVKKSKCLIFHTM